MTDPNYSWSLEVIEQLRELARSDDTEYAHIQADNILCDILENLGYKDIVDAYNDIPKYYA